jgi:endonuclease YncB( thermonuclease family)
MRPFRLLPALAAALAIAAGVCPAPAAATTHGPCIVGTTTPKCTVWRATVPYQADDGDTLDVRLDGAPRSAGLTRVRIAGIQAMELTAYGRVRAGDCHAVEAAERLDELLTLGGRRVRLAAIDPADVSRRRALRSAAVRIGGHWIDLGGQLISEGLAIWLPYHEEWEWNAAYSQLSRVSQLLGAQGLWKADACGAGPAEGVPLKVWVSSNPAGDDSISLDDEYLTVRNLDPAQSVDLSGWWVRDSGLRRYTFAAGTVLAPGGYVTVHVGHGTDTPTDRFWNLNWALFDNATGDAKAGGDGGYLFDPQGDLRAAMVYPCRQSCSDPLEGDLRLQAHPSGTEYVTVTNTSAAPVDLFGYRLFSSPYQYAFPYGTVLQPGGQLRVDVKGLADQDTPDHRHWGLDENILNNGGDRVSIQTFDQIELACDAWGSRSCS